MKKFLIFTIIISFMFASCDDFLDVKPTGKKIPASVEDFNKLLNDPTPASQGPENTIYMDPYVYMPGKIFTDLWVQSWQKQYTWADDQYLVSENDNDWNNRYTMTHVYNQILSEIDEASLGTAVESQRNLLKAEALAMRAFDFFLLVNEYAPHYSSTTVNKPGVPMPLKVDLQAKLSRSTIGDVYAQIEQDLLKAEEMYEMNAGRAFIKEASFRPGLASIKGLLGIMYQYMGDHVKAIEYTEQSLALYNFLYDYNNISRIDPANPWNGIVFDDGVTSLNHPFDYGTDNEESVWHKYSMWRYGDPSELYHPDLVALYDKSNDRRWLLWATQITYNQVDVSPDYCVALHYVESLCGITVPNVMLSNAESRARTGDGAGAIDILNQFRVKRFNAPYIPLVFTDAATALQLVKDERKREFAFSGTTFYDLKRYAAYGDVVPTFTREAGGATYTLEPNSSQYVVPTPLKVKAFNSNL